MPDIRVPEKPTPNQWEAIKSEPLTHYSDVFDTTQLWPLKGGTMKVHLKEDAHPVVVPVPQKMPMACREDIYAQLDEQEEQGVIAKVPYPTDWCHPMVVVPKVKGGWRMCIGLGNLNKYIQHLYYPLNTPWEGRTAGASLSFFLLNA